MKSYLVLGALLLGAVAMFATGCESCDVCGCFASDVDECAVGCETCPSTTAFVESGVSSDACGPCATPGYGVSSGLHSCGCGVPSSVNNNSTIAP